MSRQPKILLVGCGNMGHALLRGWLDNGWSKKDVSVIEPDERARSNAASLGVTATDALDVGVDPDLVVLAVKPQQLDTALPAYRDLADRNPVFLSIAAGIPISYLEGVLGQAAIVRGMPNMPAAIGQSMTVVVANATVEPDQRKACEDVMSAVGRVAWLEDERLMDAVTGVSGSGPAYVFLVIESLTQAGVAMGLSRELSAELAVTTVAGAGALALGAEVDAAELRRRVTSPGGTTEAALGVLMGDNGLVELMTEAVRAATERSRELA